MLPDAAAFTAALRGHFSSFALLFPSSTASGFCRSDRPRGIGSASGQSLALWPFVAFRNCFSVGIDETPQRPNQSMKPTAPPRSDSSMFATAPAVAYLFLVRRSCDASQRYRFAGLSRGKGPTISTKVCIARHERNVSTSLTCFE
jgi:hypothetical protein